MALYMTYSERTWGGGVCEGMEDDAWPNYEDAYTDFTPTGLYLERTGLVWVETIDFEAERGDVVHLVIARYSTGDTFSHTKGRWAVMGASLDPKVAANLAARINSDEFDGKEEGLAEYYHGYEGRFAPWRGYFESLEGANVHTFVVI